MPLQATSGAASYDAFGGGVPVVPNYIEEVFQTWLFDGTSATQTITNGIDLSTKGGLVWIKNRNGTYFNTLFDTVRGTSKALYSNTTDAETGTSGVTAFNTTGFTLGAGANTNAAGYTYASWTFRKQPKFFDVVTYTGDGTNRTIAHNLGSVPGCIIVKCTSTTSDWITYHRSLGNTQVLKLNTTAAAGTDATAWNNTTPTSTVFSLGTGPTNNSGETYVAYIYGNDAGGFGLAGTDNVISCGTYTGTGTAGLVVTLGYEPQWVLIKKTSSFGDWWLVDNMRGMPVGSANAYLYPNSSAAESTATVISPTATGFTVDAVSGALNGTGATYIYIAIRRGPMKVPTSGTSVFLPSTAPATTPFNVGFPPDMALWAVRDGTGNRETSTRLQGGSLLYTNSTAAEMSGYDIGWASKTNFWYQNVSGGSMINWMFRRAPSFFDTVCYTGNSTNPTAYNHNLTVVPELLIIKRRTGLSSWPVFYNFVGSTFDKLQGLNQDGVASTGQSYSGGAGLGGAPTTTTFTLDSTSTINGSGHNFVAYLFATCAGVSKVGSYTGNGSTQTIDCGFGAGGARFVLIKRTDATGDWYTYDTARGMTTLTDPYLFLNSTAAETATLGSVTTVSTGFALNATILAAINTNAASYIFLAIA